MSQPTSPLGHETTMRIARETAEVTRELLEPQIKLQSSLFDKAKGYSNVVLAVGYAGYFGVWSFSRPFLSKRQSIWVALLLLVSITVYVLFEVAIMFLQSWVVRRKSTTLFNISRDQKVHVLDIPKLFSELENDANRSLLRVAPMWPVVYAISVGCGLAGAATMVSGLLWHLFHD